MVHHIHSAFHGYISLSTASRNSLRSMPDIVVKSCFAIICNAIYSSRVMRTETQIMLLLSILKYTSFYWSQYIWRSGVFSLLLSSYAVFQNQNHIWWEREPHKGGMGVRNIRFPEITPHPCVSNTILCETVKYPAFLCITNLETLFCDASK